MEQDQLTNFLMAATKRPFLWGQSDCFIFTTEWLKEKTGTDIFNGYKYKDHYQTSKSAIKLYRNYRFKNIEHVWSHFLKKINFCDAERGDICLKNIEGFKIPASGIVLDNYLSAYKSENGLSLYPTNLSSAFFKVEKCLP